MVGYRFRAERHAKEMDHASVLDLPNIASKATRRSLNSKKRHRWRQPFSKHANVPVSELLMIQAGDRTCKPSHIKDALEGLWHIQHNLTVARHLNDRMPIEHASGRRHHDRQRTLCTEGSAARTTPRTLRSNPRKPQQQIRVAVKRNLKSHTKKPHWTLSLPRQYGHVF